MQAVSGFRARRWYAAGAFGALMALASPVVASTGCDSANNGDFDGSATLILDLDLDFGGDFDAGDVLHFVADAGTVAYVMTTLPSGLTLLTLTPLTTLSDDYTIPSTATYSFHSLLTTLTTATITITCTAASGGGGGGGGGSGGGSTDGATIGQTVDRLMLAGAEADDVLPAGIPKGPGDIREEFLRTNLKAIQNRVTALELLHLAVPDDLMVDRKLADARARLALIRRELGLDTGASGGGSSPPPASPSPALAWVSPETTGSLASAPMAALLANGHGATFKYKPGAGIDSAVTYKEFERQGTGGLSGWSLIGTQSFSVDVTPNLSIGAIGRERYSDVTTNDATASLSALAFGGGAFGLLKLADNLSLGSSVVYERGDNNATVGGASGRFGSDRVIATATLAGSMWHGPFRFTPQLDVRYDGLWREGYTDSDSTDVPAGSSQIGTLSASAELAFSQLLAGSHAITIHPYVDGGVDWQFLRQSTLGASEAALLDSNVLTLRGGGGLRLYWSRRAWMALAGSYLNGGAGHGFGATAEVNLPLGGSKASLKLAGRVDQSGAAAANARAVIPLE